MLFPPVTRVLLVKTSSLGDVVSNLPVASDIARAVPGAVIDWVVEEAFADIPRLHPAVRQVLPVALRRWKKRLLAAATWREVRAAREAIGAEEYDFVIDTQGLVKSAWLACAARGLRCGYDRASIREPLASFAYQRGFAVSWQLQAVARNRQLAAAALGYALEAAPDYGLRASAAPGLPARYAVLLTATSRAEKLWPDAQWLALGRALHARGMVSLLPAGNEAERSRAARIADGIPGARLTPPASIAELAGVLAGARVVVGVDTGLTHLAAAVGVPVVGIYCGSDPAANGVIAARAINLGAPLAAPSSAEVLAAVDRLGA